MEIMFMSFARTTPPVVIARMMPVLVRCGSSRCATATPLQVGWSLALVTRVQIGVIAFAAVFPVGLMVLTVVVSVAASVSAEAAGKRDAGEGGVDGGNEGVGGRPNARFCRHFGLSCLRATSSRSSKRVEMKLKDCAARISVGVLLAPSLRRRGVSQLGAITTEHEGMRQAIRKRVQSSHACEP